MKIQTVLCQSFSSFHHMTYTAWGRPGREPPVLCVHGLTRNGRDFDSLAQSLAQKGRYVICPDIIGRGKSDWADNPTSYNFPQYLADLTVLMGRLDCTEIDWLGTSMGGLLGLLMASKKNSPLRRLILNDVGPEISRRALRRVMRPVGEKRYFLNNAAFEAYLRKHCEGFGPLTDEQWRHLACHSARPLEQGLLAPAHDPAIAQTFGPLLFPVNLWGRYEKISIPTLVLRGENSDILPSPTALAMTQRGPRAQLITFAKVGHAPALMDAEQIQPIMDFLS